MKTFYKILEFIFCVMVVMTAILGKPWIETGICCILCFICNIKINLIELKEGNKCG